MIKLEELGVGVWVTRDSRVKPKDFNKRIWKKRCNGTDFISIKLANQCFSK